MEYRKYNDVMILEDHGELGVLARLLRNREVPIMLEIYSDLDRIKYLEQVNGAHDNVVSLLSDAEALTKTQSHPIKTQIAKDVETYIIYAANWTMQCVRNCTVRVTCLEKVRVHFDAIVKELEELNPDNKDEVDDLIGLVEAYKYRMWEYGNTSRSTLARALSREFSQMLLMEGITMEQLIARTKNNLGYREEFEDLEDSQKLEVYEDVINGSGRAKLPTMYKRKAKKPGVGDLMDIYSVAVFVVQAGVLVWDIFTVEHNIETALRETMSLLADITDFSVKLVVGAKVGHLVANKLAKMLIASLAGFVAGAVAGFIFTTVSGSILDAVFGSGGREPPNTEWLRFNTAEMPDGMVIAFELSHDRALGAELDSFDRDQSKDMSSDQVDELDSFDRDQSKDMSSDQVDE